MFTPQKLKRRETTQLLLCGPMATEAAFIHINVSHQNKYPEFDLYKQLILKMFDFVWQLIFWG